MTNKNIFIIFAGCFLFLGISFLLIKGIYEESSRNHLPTHIQNKFIKSKVFQREEFLFPDFSFTTPQNEEIHISDYKGQYVLLNLWATWCPPCVKELPLLDKLKAELENETSNIKVVAISIDHEKSFAELGGFLKKYEVGPFALYKDHQKLFTKTYSIRGMPITFLIGPDRNVLFEFQGEADWFDPKIVSFLKNKTR